MHPAALRAAALLLALAAPRGARARRCLDDPGAAAERPRPWRGTCGEASCAPVEAVEPRHHSAAPTRGAASLLAARAAADAMSQPPRAASSDSAAADAASQPPAASSLLAVGRGAGHLWPWRRGRAVCGICAICLEPYRSPRRLGCGHAFHAGCVRRWLWCRGTCPICRRICHCMVVVRKRRQKLGDWGIRGTLAGYCCMVVPLLVVLCAEVGSSDLLTRVIWVGVLLYVVGLSMLFISVWPW